MTRNKPTPTQVVLHSGPLAFFWAAAVVANQRRWWFFCPFLRASIGGICDLLLMHVLIGGAALWGQMSQLIIGLIWFFFEWMRLVWPIRSVRAENSRPHSSHLNSWGQRRCFVIKWLVIQFPSLLHMEVMQMLQIRPGSGWFECLLFQCWVMKQILERPQLSHIFGGFLTVCFTLQIAMPGDILPLTCRVRAVYRSGNLPLPLPLVGFVTWLCRFPVVK